MPEARRSFQPHHLLHLSVCHQLRLQQNFILEGFIIKSWSGWAQMMASMDATKWGWYQQDNNYIPTMLNMNAAPPSFLKVVHCNCGNICNTQCCFCKKYMLSCSSECGTYQVKTCNNPLNKHHLDYSENDD
jgi:hypothetical protein